MNLNDDGAMKHYGYTPLRRILFYFFLHFFLYINCNFQHTSVFYSAIIT